MPDGHEPRLVKSAHRALRIVHMFTEEPRPWTFEEIRDYLGYPKASLHGLLATLVAERWLKKDETSRSYVLGIRAFETGAAYRRMFRFEEQVRNVMASVNQATGETVQAAILDGLEVVYVAKIEGKRLLRLDSEVGSRLPAHATGVGKMLLAMLPEAQLDRLLEGVELPRLTAKTIVDHAALRQELERVRAQGFSTDDEEATEGARCIAVPVFDETSRCIAALSSSVPTVHFNSAMRKKLLDNLVPAARDFSAQLGYRSSYI